MAIAALVVFILGYLLIAMEDRIAIDKAATALICGVLCWILRFASFSDNSFLTNELMQHVGSIASLLFFLLAAMTIVELIDVHDGFDVLSAVISAKKMSTVLIVIGVMSFFLSAIIDNLTTAIVMCTLVRKLFDSAEDRRWFCAVIILAANAGGAWSPIGDVTTSMLWISSNISALSIMKNLFLPAVICAAVPTWWFSRKLKGRAMTSRVATIIRTESKIMLGVGMSCFAFVPILHSISGIPPFAAMLFALGLMWLLTTVMHRSEQLAEKQRYSVAGALQKIDSPSILFFLGILLAVAALESFGVLQSFSSTLLAAIPMHFAVAGILGLLSAVVDNIPLVAASQAMMDTTIYACDHPFWHALALTTGTGGSMLIIGSAAGVAVMGMEKISFSWYLKKVSLVAFVSTLLGLAFFIVTQ